MAANDSGNSITISSSMTSDPSPTSLPAEQMLQPHSSTTFQGQVFPLSPSSLLSTGREVKTVMQPPDSSFIEGFSSSPSSLLNTYSTRQQLPTTTDTQKREVGSPPLTSPERILANGSTIDRMYDNATTPTPPLYSAGHSNPLQSYAIEQHFCPSSLQDIPWNTLEPPPPYILRDQEQIPGKSISSLSSDLNSSMRRIDSHPEEDKCYQYSVLIFACGLLFFLILPLIILSSANYDI